MLVTVPPLAENSQLWFPDIRTWALIGSLETGMLGLECYQYDLLFNEWNRKIIFQFSWRECDRMKCWVNTNPGQLLPGKNYQARIDWQGAVRSWAPGLAEINHSRPLLCLPFSDIWREKHLGTELGTMFAIYYHCQDVASGENKLTEVGR